MFRYSAFWTGRSSQRWPICNSMFLLQLVFFTFCHDVLLRSRQFSRLQLFRNMNFGTFHFYTSRVFSTAFRSQRSFFEDLVANHNACPLILSLQQPAVRLLAVLGCARRHSLSQYQKTKTFIYGLCMQPMSFFVEAPSNQLAFVVRLLVTYALQLLIDSCTLYYCNSQFTGTAFRPEHWFLNIYKPMAASFPTLTLKRSICTLTIPFHLAACSLTTFATQCPASYSMNYRAHIYSRILSRPHQL